jgi:hypothetical protein
MERETRPTEHKLAELRRSQGIRHRLGPEKGQSQLPKNPINECVYNRGSTKCSPPRRCRSLRRRHQPNCAYSVSLVWTRFKTAASLCSNPLSGQPRGADLQGASTQCPRRSTLRKNGQTLTASWIRRTCVRGYTATQRVDSEREVRPTLELLER